MATAKKDNGMVRLWLVGINSYNLVGAGPGGSMLKVKRGESALFTEEKAKELVKRQGVINVNGSNVPCRAFTREAAVASDALGYDVTKGAKAHDIDNVDSGKAPDAGAGGDTVQPGGLTIG